MVKISISENVLDEIRSFRDKIGTKTHSRTIKWLLANKLDKPTIEWLEEIRKDNEYDTISEVIGHLIEELLKFQEMDEQKQEGH